MSPITRAPLDPSTQANLVRREGPQIGGSVGGFVALIVCLVAVIIISVTGIVYLWREEGLFSSTSSRSQRHRYQSRSNGSSRSFHPFSPKKWIKSLTFGSRSTPGSSAIPPSGDVAKSSIKGKNVRGWVRASSADDWLPDNLRQLSYSHASRPVSLSPPSSSYSPSPQPDPSLRVPTSRLDSSSSVVRFEHLPQHVTVYHPIVSASPQPSIPTITTVPSSPPESPPPPIRTLSPEPIIEDENNQSDGQPPPEVTEGGRKFAVHSGMSMQTLARGTKFIESL